MLRDGDGRIFLDVNPAFFRSVVDYLNECKIASTDSTLGKPHVGKEDGIVLQQLLLEFGLGDDRLVYSKISDRNPKIKENKAESDAHSRVPQNKWKNMKFDKWKNVRFNKFPMWNAHNIRGVPEKVKKSPFLQQVMNLIISVTYLKKRKIIFIFSSTMRHWILSGSMSAAHSWQQSAPH